jgi:cytochrome P450
VNEFGSRELRDGASDCEQARAQLAYGRLYVEETHGESGQAVVVWLGSANHDEEVFRNTFVFDIRRQSNRHLAFGVGPHYCVGHTVARVTLRLLFEELFDRFTDFAPAGPVERLRSDFVAGIKYQPITARVRPDRARR